MQKIIGLVHTRFSAVGGVENYISKLVPALLERDWLIHYFTAKINKPVPRRVIIHKIPIIRGTSLSRMLSFAYGGRRAIQQADLPLVMGFGRTIYQDIYRDGSGCFLDYEKHAGKRFNRLYRKCYLHLERKRYKDARLKKVVTVSQMVKDQIIRRYHIPSEKIEVLYSGIAAHVLNPDLKKQKSDYRKQLQIPEDVLTLLFIGNEFKRKGLEFLINAVACLPERLPLMVLVAGSDKKAGHYLKLAKATGRFERFRFLGYQKDVSILYGAADLFVLPSLFDPIANVVLESLYTGTPVVTGKQVGASELIEHGLNGYIVTDYSQENLAQAILSYHHSLEKEKMSQRAHRVAAAYRWDDHFNRLEAIFLGLLKRR